MIHRKHLLTGSILAVVMLVPQTPLGATGSELWGRLLAGEDAAALEEDIAARLEESKDDAAAHVVHALLLERRLAGLGSREAEVKPWEAWLNAAAAYEGAPESDAALLKGFDAALGMGDVEAFESYRKRVHRRVKLPSWLEARHSFVEINALRSLGKFRDAEKLADRLGFVADWSYLAPFDNAEKRGHDQVLPPERELDFDAQVQGRNGDVTWRHLPVEPALGYVDLDALVRPARESTTYLATTVNCDEATRAAVHVGHAGAVKVWVNGVLVLEVDRYHQARADQASCVSELRPGLNLILAKVSSDESNVCGLFLRLIHADKGHRLPVDGSLEALRKVPGDRRQVLSGSSPTFELQPPSITTLAAAGPSRPPEHLSHVLYATLLQRLHVLDRDDISAYEILSKIQTAYPDCSTIAQLAANADLQVNRRRVNYRRAVELDSGNLYARLQELLLARGRPFYAKRRTWVRDALDVSGQHPVFLAEYARQLTEQNQSGPALAYLHRALEQDPKNFDYLLLAANLSQEQLPPQIRSRWFERAIASRRDALAPHLSLLRMALDADEIRDARRQIEKIAEIDPWNATPYRTLGRYHNAASEFEPAGEAIAAGLAISPDDAELHRLEAERLDALGAPYEDIVPHLSAVLRAEPSDPWTLDFLETVSPDGEDYYTPYRKDWKELPEPPEALLEDASAVVLLSQDVNRVHPNGNASRTVHRVVKILNETGIGQHATWPVFYEPGREEVKILTARVTQPDGSVVDAPAPRHQNTSNAGDAARRLYGDQYVAVLRMPSIQVGSIIEVEYQTEERGENIFADYFGDVSYMGGFDPTAHYEYILITPKEREFYWKAIAPTYPPGVVDSSLATLTPEPVLGETPGERIYGWRATNLPRVPRESRMPASSEVLPYLKISTFKTWNDMTTWYWKLIEDQFVADPTVRRQTEEVLSGYREENGLDSEAELTLEQKVSAINRFVNSEVRYLGLEFGVHGWKPHKASDILQARYGDCKDKAALAISMLDLVGVRADFAILRWRPAGEIDYELPSMGLFNHAIYYVPELGENGRFIDGTAEYYGAFDLPDVDAGVNMLTVEKGGKSRFIRSPVPSADENGGTYTTALTLALDGSANGERHCDYVGLYNPLVRATYQNTAKAPEIIERQLVSNYPGSRCVEVELSDLETYDDESIHYALEIPNFAAVSGAETGRRGMDFPASLFPEGFSSRYASSASRHYDLVLNEAPWYKKNVITIELPPGSEIPSLPPPVELENDFGRFRWNARLEGRTLTIEEETALGVYRVAKKDFQLFRDFCRRVDEAQERRIRLEVAS